MVRRSTPELELPLLYCMYVDEIYSLITFRSWLYEQTLRTLYLHFICHLAAPTTAAPTAAPSTTAPPPPVTTTGDHSCPGGSLGDCIKLCPADPAELYQVTNQRPSLRPIRWLYFIIRTVSMSASVCVGRAGWHFDPDDQQMMND